MKIKSFKNGQCRFEYHERTLATLAWKKNNPEVANFHVENNMVIDQYINRNCYLFLEKYILLEKWHRNDDFRLSLLLNQ